jgi:hypothetical protein
MSDETRLFHLRIALIVFGLIFIFGIYPLGILWPSGWTWGQGHSHYLMMIIGIYATLGVFLLIASRDPNAHKSLIWFTHCPLAHPKASSYRQKSRAAVVGRRGFFCPPRPCFPFGFWPCAR